VCSDARISMLDDRNATVSSKQYINGGTWDRRKNEFGWRCLLGDKAGGEDVDIYAAPGRATDLSGLPSTFIDVGSAEVFKDESVAYASRLWASGVQAELHVWPGAYHASDMVALSAKLPIIAKETRKAWVCRTLGIRAAKEEI